MSNPKSVTPVKVKKEILDEVGHTAIIPLKLEESQSIIDDGLTISEVEQIINGKDEENKIHELHQDALEVILEVWRSHNKTQVDSLQKMDRDDMISELENARYLLNPPLFTTETPNNEGHDEEVDKKVDEIFNTVKDMNISADTTDDELSKYSHVNRARFVYWLQLKKDGKVVPYDELVESSETFVLERMKEWRNQQKSNLDVIMEDSSVDEDDLYQSSGENVPNISTSKVSTVSEDAQMKDPPDEEEIATENKNVDEISIDKSPVSPAMEPNTICLQLTDMYLNSKTTDEMKIMLYNHYNTTGSSISQEIINVYSRKYLLKSIKELREKMRPKPSSMKQKSKYTNPIQANLQMKTCQNWRYSINFTLTEDIKGTDALRTYLSDIFHEMCSYCAGLLLLPWNSEDTKNSIDDCENLPTTITHLQKYFEGIRSPAGMSRMYARFRLGIPIKQNRQTFEADIIGWAKAKEIRISECSVQHPRVKTCCWMVYLANSVDKDKWCRAVQSLYNKFTKQKDDPGIQLGLVWRALNGQANIDRKKKVYAMHVDAPRHLNTKVKQFLRMLAQNNKFLPLGIRFRVMDEYTQYMSDTTKAKYRYMVSKHKTFLSEIKQVSTDAIIELDKRIGESKMTVRDVINGYTDIKDGKRVFATINAKWNDAQTHIALFRPDKVAQAYAFIQSISTYVYHTFPTATNLHKLFTVESLEQARNEQYHPGTQTFVTQAQIDLDKEIQADLDDEWLDFCTVQENPFEVDISNTRLVGGEKLYCLTGDDDTASTVPATSSQISFASVGSVHHYDPSISSSETIGSINSSTRPQQSVVATSRSNASDVADKA